MKTAIKTAFATLLLATLMAVVPATAQEAGNREEMMKKFEADGGKMGFLGHAYGLDGWIVISPSGDIKYIYTTPDGAMMTGMLYAPDGSSETLRQLKAYQQRMTGGQAATPGADNAVNKSERLYAAAEGASWAAIGDKNAPYLYVFMNTNCGHCRDFWLDLADQVTAGKLQVRLIPYGEAPANRDGAAALLSAAQPLETWKAYVGGDATVLGKDKIADGAYAKVDANTALVKKWRIPEPPFTVYRRPADGEIKAILGRPDNKMLLPAEFLK